MKILCVFGRHAYGDPSRGESYESVNFLPAFARLGHEVELFDSFSRSECTDFADMNVRLLRHVDRYKPDLIFLVLMGYEIWTETLDLIRANSPAILVNWGTDDSWKFMQVSRFLARHLDVHVTTYDRAAARARDLGLGNVIVSNWAASHARLAPPLPAADCRYDVSFIGNIYGNRRAWIEGLAARGIKVETFGNGSEHGVVSADDVFRIYRQSRISLNFADSGWQLDGWRLHRSRQIKARTFEVPGAGGFLLTQGADALPDYFRIGEEIATFETLDDLAEKIRLHLGDPARRDRMAVAAHETTRERHTYEHRFAALFAQIESRLPPQRRCVPWSLDEAALQPHVLAYRKKGLLAPLRGMLTGPARLAFGARRGTRAARRVLFELSWRLFGRRTFSAKGLPGRLFYHES
jgi:spore maturation protein CgeB